MAGFRDIGAVLSGGIDREGAYQQGRYRSAQTEEALSNARKSQAAAIREERINRLADQLISTPPDFASPSNQNLADIMVAGLGSDFSAANQGALAGQKRRLNDVIANPETDYETVQRLRAAVGETPFNPINPAGTHGAFVDARHPELGVQAPIGDQLIPVDPTPAERNYDRYRKEGGAGGADVFSRFAVPDQVMNAGGVPVVRDRITGKTSQPVTPDAVATNVGAIAGAKTTAQGQAKRTLDLPAAKSRVAATNAKLDSLAQAASTLQSSEDLWKAVGLGKPIASIPGTAGAKVRALINTLKSKIGFAVLQDMRESSKTGGALGNISNQENTYLQNALAALDINLSPEDFRDQLQIVVDYAAGGKKRIQDAFLETYPEMAQQPTAATPGESTGVVKWGRDANGKPVRVQ